jgi:hypothetical protein
MLKQFEQFTLKEDINPVIIKGMVGVVLDIYEDGDAFEAEFVQNDGSNYSYLDQSTFAIRWNQVERI